jgi:signal transduction histidine kinase
MAASNDIVEVLRNSTLFKSLSDDELVAIASRFAVQTFASGQIIFDDGSVDTNGMYVIRKGTIKIFKSVVDDSSRQQAVAVLKEGNFFGEMALLDEEVRSAGAAALDDCELLFLSRASFNEIIGQNLETAHRILTQIAKVMSRRLRDTNNLFREVVSWGYRARREVRDLKSNFLSTISHELRTPIHSIQGFTSLMKDTEEIDRETQKKFIEVILEESKRLAGLINDLISLAEIEYGAIILERQSTKFKDVIEKVFESYRSEAEEKKLQYELFVPKDLPALNVDANRLEQAIEHIIENAIKFTDFNGRVSTRVEDRKNAIEIIVSDNGRGIPAKYIDRIFGKFYQVDQSTTRSVDGAGIGLTLARHIIDLHGGQITVTSKEGDGSTFKITLPKEHVIKKS